MRQLMTWEQLQTLIGRDSEGADLDFKESFDVAKAGNDIEAAKDVAALANVLGGHIVIGASTELGGTRCKGFHGIHRDVAVGAAKHFEEKVKERCRPTPSIAVCSIDVPHSANLVIVVAVEASPVAPVGVSVRQPENGLRSDEGWIFPHRVGSRTPYLQPDQFGAYESMTSRRAAAWLSAIPDDQRLTITIRWVLPDAGGGDDAAPAHGAPLHLEALKARFDRVDLGANVAIFTDLNGQHGVEVPLDQIQTVWRRSKKQPSWEVSLRGSLHLSDGEWQHWPTP